VKSAEGEIEFAVPQLADMAQPFRSKIREVIRGRTEELERLAVEMYARGLSVRDIEAAFTDEAGRCLLSRTAASELTERLWADYQSFASRDLAEFKLLYLFVDGIAEKLHLGQQREAVLTAWGIIETGHKVLLGLAPGTKEDTASCRDFLRDLKTRNVVDPVVVITDGAPGLIRAAEEVFSSQSSPALPGAQDPKPAEQGARRGMARGQGRCACRLPSRECPGRADAQRRFRRALRARLSERDVVFPGRLRRLHRAPAAADLASARNAHDEHARAALRRGAPANQGHSACFW
jgi:Transposase, Mutator family